MRRRFFQRRFAEILQPVPGALSRLEFNRVPMRALLRCRLCWRITLIVFFSILTIEAAIKETRSTYQPRTSA